MLTRVIAVLCLVLGLSACSDAAPPPAGPTSASAQLKENLHRIYSAPGGTFTFEVHVNGRLRYSARTTYDLKRHAQVARVRYNPARGPVVKILVKQVGGRRYVQLLRGPYRGCWIDGSYATASGIRLLTDQLISPFDVLRSMKATGFLQNEVRAKASTNAVMSLFNSLRTTYGRAPRSSLTPMVVDLYDDRLVYQIDGADLGRAMVKSMHLPRKQVRDGQKTKVVTIVIPASPFNTRIEAPKPDTMLTTADFVPGTLGLQPGAGCH